MTKLVVALVDGMSYVIFDRKIDDPWSLLSQLSDQVPELLDRTVRFSRRIPEGCTYIAWESGNTQIKKVNYKEAIRFLKPRKPLRTLGELLQKYANASK